MIIFLILLQPKQKTDDINEAPPNNIPEVPQTTSSSTLSPPSNAIDDHSSSNGVYISPNSNPERTSSFFAQPGILAGNLLLKIEEKLKFIKYLLILANMHINSNFMIIMSNINCV